MPGREVIDVGPSTDPTAPVVSNALMPKPQPKRPVVRESSDSLRRPQGPPVRRATAVKPIEARELKASTRR